MIYLDVQDIEQLRGCSKNTASHYYRTLLFLSGKQEVQKLTIFDYCKLEDIPFEFVDCILPRFSFLSERLKTTSNRVK